MIIKLKLNHTMAGYEAGREVAIQTDAAGVPLDKFWRRRLKDAEIDNCVEAVKPAEAIEVVKPPKTKKSRQEQDK